MVTTVFWRDRMYETKKYTTGEKLQFLWKNMGGQKALYIVAMIGTALYCVMQLVVPYFSGEIVDRFLTGENAAANLAAHRDEFYGLVAAMVGFTLLRTILVYIDCQTYEHVSQGVLFNIRNYLYRKIEHQDMKFYSAYRTGDLMTRVTGDLDAARHMLAWVVRVVVESIALYCSTMIFFMTMNLRMALCIMAVSPIIFVIILSFKKKIAPLHAKLREKLAGMNTDAQENISGNRVVKAFAKEDYEMEKFDHANRDYRDTNIECAGMWIKYYPYIESTANLMSVLLILCGGLFMINGDMTMGEYVAFSGLIWAVAGPMRQMGNIMNEFERFLAAVQKVMEIYYSEPDIKDAPDAIDRPDRFEGRIEFKNVSFQYADGNMPVLKNISFTAEPGETVAIMGETGCGKSSLIHMIPRFYEQNEGEILIDGIDIRKMKLAQLRKNIGLATQDVLLYSDSIEGNIAYGDPHIKKEQVVKFSRYSAADEFIAKMPEGYDTIVGERGVGLSGGQKQRISLARALAVEPSILILDDTTSAVDMETEKHIQDSLKNLDFKCTKLIIAQRISTTRTADKILVLKDGRITEQGSHEELIAKGGYYADLVKLQTGA